jgi:putative toxin-antitoxin system antitoxin component (TIGR02293 family)
MIPTEILRVLGGPSVFKGRYETALDLVDLGGRGLTKASLLKLAEHWGLTTAQLAQLLPVTERTIQRYSKGHHLSRAVSDRMLELANVAVRGAEVFGDRDTFLAWTTRPAVVFASRTPFDLLASQIGTDLVLDELGRIEHGIVS